MKSKREQRIEKFLEKIGLTIGGGNEASFEGVINTGVCAIEAIEEVRQTLG